MPRHLLRLLHDVLPRWLRISLQVVLRGPRLIFAILLLLPRLLVFLFFPFPDLVHAGVVLALLATLVILLCSMPSLLAPVTISRFLCFVVLVSRSLTHYKYLLSRVTNSCTWKDCVFKLRSAGFLPEALDVVLVKVAAVRCRGNRVLA